MKTHLSKLIIAPRVTEKANRIADQGKQKCIVFKVARDADKANIKTAVEQQFSVKVESVRTVLIKGKVRRFGRMEGRTKDWKKAYVKLQPGHDISFAEAVAA